MGGRRDHTDAADHVVVCAGKDCRRRDEFEALCGELERVATVGRVGCLGLCHSPVVVLDPDGDRPVVLEKVRTKKQRRDIVASIDTGAQLTDRLRSRRPSTSQSAKAVRRMRRRRAA